MKDLLIFLNWLLPLLYLAVVIDYGVVFFLRKRTHVRNPWLLVVIGVHAAMLVLRSIDLGRLPLGDSYEVLSAVAASAAAVYWLLELASRDRRAGLFVFLLIFGFQYTSSLFLTPAIVSPATVDAQASAGGWHALPALVAYTAFAFAAVYGAMHLLALHGLKRKRFGVLFDRLPPLELLGGMTWHAMAVGLVFMTASIVSGVITAAGAEPTQIGKL